MNEALITVIVPAYNHEKYIGECLESIHHQTYRSFQWIVVDDCSTDNTPKILIEKQKEYGYELILHKHNYGIADTLSEIIKNYVRGEFLTICASDDIFLPNKVEKQLFFLQENPKYSMCYSRAIPINELSEEIPYSDSNRYKSGYIFEDVICRNFFMGIATMYRTDIIKKVGYYEPGIIAEDYYLYSKIAKVSEIGFLDDYLYKYRVVELSKKRDAWALVMSHRQTIEMFKDDPIFHKAIQSWEIKSAETLSRCSKYKIKAIMLCIKNIGHFLKQPRNGLNIIKYLLLAWK